MKKDLIFAPVLLIIAGLLFMLRMTGFGAHIALAVIGVFVLGAYTALTKKQWKIPALEIITRVLYGTTLVLGATIMNVHNIAALPIAHKISAALFALSLIILTVTKFVFKKSK